MNTELKRIDFNYNWNNKLGCNAFTTFRVFNPEKYILDEEYDIYLKNQFVCKAKIIRIKILKLNEINSFISYIDTGYSEEEFKEIVKKMYPGADNKTFMFILLKKTK